MKRRGRIAKTGSLAGQRFSIKTLISEWWGEVLFRTPAYKRVFHPRPAVYFLNLAPCPNGAAFPLFDFAPNPRYTAPLSF
jgi:hypothetical protein